MTDKRRKQRPGSRHKDRHMVSLDGESYLLLKRLADHFERPAAWQLRIAIRDAARSAGLLDPPAPPDES